MIAGIRRTRRTILVGTLLAIASCGSGAAQSYPTRPIRWLIGFPPGGPTDILVRLMGEWLQSRLGQPVVVENRPGAASNIATEALVNAAPDGYTIGSVTSANAINATVNRRTLTFDFLKSLAPVAGMSQGPSVLVVNPAVPAQTLPELIAYAKANPGKINFGSPGVGSTGHLAGELFKAMAGVDLVHVPYRGAAPAMTDLIGGQIQVLFDSMVSVLPHVRSGRVRALGVTSATRSALLPDLPAIAETVPGYESVIWFGVGVPRGTPPEVIALLNREINAGLDSGPMKAKLRARHRADGGDAGSVLAIRQERDGEMGDGDPARGNQGRLKRSALAQIYWPMRLSSACAPLDSMKLFGHASDAAFNAPTAAVRSPRNSCHSPT